MNQKGFANIALIILVIILACALGYVTLIKKPAKEQSQTNNLQNTTPPSNNTVSQNPPTNISQLTKSDVLNGYDQCGNQFKNGEITVDLNAPCAGYVTLFADNMIFADLDGDGILEAVLPARIVLASSGGELYVFKNQNGTAHVVAKVVIGKENIKVVSVSGNVIVGKTDGAMGYTPTTQTYKFTNGKLVKQ